jgi:hypothetical protein
MLRHRTTLVVMLFLVAWMSIPAVAARDLSAPVDRAPVIGENHGEHQATSSIPGGNE